MSGKPRKNCSIRDLASYVGLSTCTVSKVLNDVGNKFQISERTRQLVRDAARKLNYVPNINAQRLFRKKSNVIGLLLPFYQDDTTNSVFHDQHLARIMGSISLALRDSNYQLMLLFNDAEVQKQGRYEAMFRSHLLDGLLIWGIHRDEFYWTELVSAQTPTIFLTTTPEELSNTPVNYIVNDFEYAGYKMACQLLEQGCRYPLCLSAGPSLTLEMEYQRGIHRALQEFGVPLDNLQTKICGYLRTDLLSLLVTEKEYDGIIAHTDSSARAITAVMAALGRNIPLVCLDSAENMAVPGVSTMIPQDALIGREAVKSLLTLIEGDSRVPVIQKKIPGIVRG